MYWVSILHDLNNLIQRYWLEPLLGLICLWSGHMKEAKSCQMSIYIMWKLKLSLESLILALQVATLLRDSYIDFTKDSKTISGSQMLICLRFLKRQGFIRWLCGIRRNLATRGETNLIAKVTAREQYIYRETAIKFLSNVFMRLNSQIGTPTIL